MATRSIPPVGFRFNINFFFGGTPTPFTGREGPDAYFQSVSGISVEFESEPVQDGANSTFVQVLPKKPIYPKLVLKRGVLINSEIFKWITDQLGNASVTFQPLDVEVSLLNENSESILNFRFSQAWPSKWSLSDFNAMESGVVIETLELVYQYFKIHQN